MSTGTDYFSRSERLVTLINDRLGVNAKTFPTAFQKVRRRLPRKIQLQGDVFVKGLAQMGHPRLRQTVDMSRLEIAENAIREYLESIDVADRRKGWWLNLLGGIAFNVLAVIAILLIFLVWRGYL